MKRCFVTGLVAALLLGITPVYASSYENGQYVTFEEYSAAITEEYAKYGLEGGVYEPEGEFLCTYETMQNDLATVREFCEAYVENQPVSTANEPETKPAKSPLVMIDTVTKEDMYTHVDLSLPVMPQTCTIKTTVDIDVDYQSANIVWVYEPTLEVMAATGFDDWIEYVDHSTDIEQDKNRVTMDITCKIKQEMSLGTTTSWSKITISYPAVFRNVI